MGSAASKESTDNTKITNLQTASTSESVESDSAENTTSSSKCPVKFGKSTKGLSNPHLSKNNDTSNTNGSSSSSACPVKHNSTNENSNNTSACPVKHSPNQTQYNVYSQPLDPKNNMPVVANQLPSAQQKEELSTERKQSSIPKGGTDSDTWTYPSPQMFYNACK